MRLPFDKVFVGDFETYWCTKTGYTLSKMTTEQYVRDHRFRAHGISWKYMGEGEPQWVTHADLPKFLASIDWSRTAFAAHNAQFDASIAAWHYGVHPAFIFDTLSMARATRGIEAGNSLKKLAEEFGLPPKGDALGSTDGVEILTAEQEAVLVPYANHDCWLGEEVLNRLLVGFPPKELRLIDMTIRMFTEATLVLDKSMLVEAIHEEKEKREALIAQLGIEESSLASNDQFAEVLRGLGEEPPLKVSPTTGKQAYAFSKKDALFQALMNHDREEIALLCEARLKVKSTLERTRAQRFLDIAQRGPLPVPLNYYGAHTGRWAAAKGSGINMQNLKRGSFLRRAIMAPEGYELVVADLSQIEPRVLAWLSDYRDLLQIFASGKDAYAAFGATMFGVPGMTKDSHPVLRQSAKSALLGAGYGLGWLSFAAQLLTGFLGAPPVRYDKAFAKQLGVTTEDVMDFMGWERNMERALSVPRTCSDAEIVVHCVAAKMIIDKYREAATPVVEFWELCNEMIARALAGGREYRHKCLTFRLGEVVLPNGMTLKYPHLTGNPDEKGRVQWTYLPVGRKKPVKLYGGKLTENIVQAVARCVMTDGMLRIDKRYPCVLTVHDEAGALARADEAKAAYEWMVQQMTVEPKYMPGIPLAASGGHARRYGDAKD